MGRIGTIKKMSTKEYNSSEKDQNENARLVTQASTIEVFDGNVMQEFLKEIKKSGKKSGDTIYILELGGADMKGATISRYNQQFFDTIAGMGYKVKIINAEYNADAIKTANEMFGNRYTSVQIDLNNSPIETLEKVAEKYTDGNKFDMVFSNYVLQHLAYPQEVMVGVQHVLSKNGLSMHRVPDDKLKVEGFHNTDGTKNERANAAATRIVELFLTTLLRSRTDRRLGGKLFDVCTTGYENRDGINFNNAYDRIAVEVVEGKALPEEKKAYLERDFRWYMFALEDAAQDPSDPEFQAKCSVAAKEGWENYKILMEEFVQKDDTNYHYGEHEIIVSNELTMENTDTSYIDSNRTVFVIASCENGKIRKDRSSAK